MNQRQKIALTSVVILLIAAAAGGAYYLWQGKKPAAAQQAARGETLYTCVMHPFIIKDKPGSCPICGMQLIKKIETPQGGQPANQMQQMPGHVSLSASQEVMANVAVAPVRRIPLTKEVAATGIVQYDQTRQAKVTAWVAGRIDRLFVGSVGAYVAKGKPVAEIYSPDLVAAQQEYLLARRSRDQFRNSTIAAIAQGGEGLVSSARERLKLLGVKDEQIAGLERAGHPNIKLPIYTPLSGVVVEKIVQEGQYVNVGDPLFNIADFSHVWVEVELYENEFSFVKQGQRVEITSQSYPGTTFSGRVAFIYPFLDPKTRTVKVRVEMANPGGKLKPDMFVNAVIKMSLGNALAVPSSAVIDSGRRQTVWVEMKPGMFEPRDVQVGARVGENVQILSGLKPGERVAVSGGYLLDSESQLKGQGGGHESMPGMQMEAPKGAPAPAPAPGRAPAPPAKDGGMKMDDMKM